MLYDMLGAILKNQPEPIHLTQAEHYDNEIATVRIDGGAPPPIRRTVR